MRRGRAKGAIGGAHRRATLALLVLAGLASVARAQEILPLAEVRAGQHGYGLSVFQGDRPERFEVEVLGVWQNLRPDTSFILARLSGHGLETSGVIAGMSGSPVYLDGRLAGAVAFAWPFAHEAVAGITPIESMRRLYAAQPAAAGPARGSPPVSLEQLVSADLPQDLLDRGLAVLHSEGVERFGSGLMWSTVGFGELSRQRLATSLGNVAPAGTSRLPPAELVPGGSVAGVLIDGDLRMAATGTVTDRVGDSLLAFGHPFLGIGELSVPMATSEVITVLSSQFNSFKISNLGSVVGAFELDRAAGIRGRLGAVAPSVPLHISVDGGRRAEYDLRLAALPQLTPALAAISVLAALDATTQSGGSQGLDLRARLDMSEHGELLVRQSFDGDSAAMEAAVYLLAFAGFLTNNPMAEVQLAGIDVELEQHPQPRLARLVEAHASRTLLQPGERLELNLDFMAYRGERFREAMALELPTHLPDGRYSLLVGDGVSVDAARLAIERSAPVHFRQALDLLRGLHSRRDLVVLGVFAGRGLAVAGETLPQLPGSLRSIWAAAPSGSAQELRLAVAQQKERRLEMPVSGLLRVDLEVRRREPVAAEASAAQGAPVARDSHRPSSVRGAPATTDEGQGTTGTNGRRRDGIMRWRFAVFVSVLALIVAPPAAAAEAGVRFFRLHTREALLGGTLDGLSVDPLGTLRLADRALRLAAIGEPFLFSAASHPDGWVLGTGNDGKVILVDRSGEVRTLFSAPEPEVFAVWADPDGTVFAGTSPNGKVYRIVGDEAEPFFDPGDTYIWAIARSAAGGLLVATGTEGRLWQVDDQGRGEVLFDSEDTHLRSLELLPGGDLLAGTAGEGLILRIDPRGKARTLFDGAQPEVVALAGGADGWCYALLLASESSFTDLRRPSPGKAKESKEAGDGEEETGTATVTVVAEGEAAAAAGSRPAGFSGARSELVRIAPSGRVESVWQFSDETAYALLWHRDRLWVATGLEGKLYSFRDGDMVLEKDVDERQVVALLTDDPGPAFATTNAAALYRLSAESERRGTFTSPALNAGQIANFGSLRWRGRLQGGAKMRFSARSGMSASPDATWSEWTEAGDRRDVPLAGLAPGRYLQWRAELEAADSVSPELSEVTVSYRQSNLPPRIESLTVLDPGEILVPTSFNPSNQVFEPVHPNRDGIFTTLDTGTPREDQRFKTLWKRGYRSLRWQAEDPNEDELIYELAFRTESGADEWLPVADEIDASHYGFDATALPDGLYRFRLRAADRPGNSLDEAMVAVEVSEPVLIDHTPPALVDAERRDGGLRVELADAWSPLRSAEVSADGGPWQPLRAVDGLLDGQREDLLVDRPGGAKLLLLRVTDAAFNTITFDLTRAAR